MAKKVSDKILIVEDTKSISNYLCRQIESTLHFTPIPAYTLREAETILKQDESFFIALLDLNLPDAPEGEIVDLVLAKKIPAIILTGTFDEKVREDILSKNVVDYVIKTGFHALEHIAGLIRRIHRNQSINVLIVDDSRSFRMYAGSLLKAHRYKVIEADNGKTALARLQEHSDIKLIITDYNMPVMDGFEFVSAVRKKYNKNEMAIIGLSAQGSGLVSAKFLKNGANDFLQKPFVTEEFYARVSQNIELIEYIEQLKEAAIRDPLTKLHNRRFFFEEGPKRYEACKVSDRPLTVAMIDIDHFKKINDTYGHEAGDLVLEHIARILLQSFGKAHIVSRFGGEEFCVLAYGVNPKRAKTLFEDIRAMAERAAVDYQDKQINFTISIGLSTEKQDALENMIKMADDMLYRAKNEGRNRVISDS